MPQPSPPLHHHHSPSPATHASPSTVDASPLTPGPPLSSAPFDSAARRSAASTRQRASIACTRCRRSKTRCINNGINTLCKTCQEGGHQCSYSEIPPGPSGGLESQQRRESTVGDHEAPPKKRRKNLAPLHGPGHARNQLGTYETALLSPLLTSKVWKELFDIYERHFAVDFPFIHKRTFFDLLEQMPQASNLQDKKTNPAILKRPHRAQFLLAFLTQTARFHPELIKEEGSGIATANFYAEACRSSLEAMPSVSDQDLVHAHLLLGYHEWTNGEGSKGFLRVRIAISLAQLLGYQADADLDDQDYVTPTDADADQDRFIEREIARRTIWSCFCLDRYMSMKGNCPQMFKIEDLKGVQLVCSNESFMRGRRVKTRLLGEDDAAYAQRRNCLSDVNKRLHDEADPPLDRQRNCLNEIQWELGEREAGLIYCIQAIDLLSEIVRWTLAKGRRQEGTTPPWHSKSNFRKLESSFEKFRSTLPADLRLSPRNTKNQVYGDTWDNYITIHAMCTLCTVVLYREYLAFAPWNLSKPEGPVDPPKLVELPPKSTYWVDQAKSCWVACQDFAELLHEAKQKDAVVENPMVAFATYSVGWCAVYCHYFPNMDPDKTLHYRKPISAWDVANEYLSKMLGRFYKAEFWLRELKNVKDNYHTDRKKYKSVGGQPQGGSPSSTSSDTGGGLKEYVSKFEKSQKEFGGQDFSSRDWDGKDLNAADMKLIEHTEYEDRQEMVTPGATPKIEPRETPETMISRTPSYTPSFTAVNHPSHERTSAPTPEYQSAGTTQRYTPTMPPLNSPIVQASPSIENAYSPYPMPTTQYSPYAPNPTYMPVQQPLDFQYHPAVFGPAPLYVPPDNTPARTTSQIKYMENRGMDQGDMSFFSENPLGIPTDLPNNNNSWMQFAPMPGPPYPPAWQ